MPRQSERNTSRRPPLQKQTPKERNWQIWVVIRQNIFFFANNWAAKNAASARTLNREANARAKRQVPVLSCRCQKVIETTQSMSKSRLQKASGTWNENHGDHVEKILTWNRGPEGSSQSLGAWIGTRKNFVKTVGRQDGCNGRSWQHSHNSSR